MPRHLVDRDRAVTPARLLNFLRLDRSQGRHPALGLIDRRRPAAPAEARLAPFLRILRGRSA